MEYFENQSYCQIRHNKYHCFIACFIIMKTISEMNAELQLLRANDKAKAFTQQGHSVELTTPALEGLVNLLELFQFNQLVAMPQAATLKNQIKFCSRTIFIALVSLGGDNSHSVEMVKSMLESSYYLGHEMVLSWEGMSQSVGSSGVSQYLQSQQHQNFSNDIYSLIGQHFKLSTPYDYSKIISIHLNSPNFQKVLTSLIDFALTIPEASCLSSQEIFVACCLLVCQKPNSSQLLSLLNLYFGDSLQAGAGLKGKIKEFFEIVNT